MDRIIPKKKWTPKKIALIVFPILFAALMVHLFFFRDTSSRLYVDQSRMTIATVMQNPFQEFIPIDGVVQPLVTMYVDAVFGGRVEEIYVRDGAILEEGDKILRLSNLSMEMQYVQQENQSLEVLNQYQNTYLNLEQNKFTLERQLADLDYQLEIAERNFYRNQEFHQEGVISDEEFENAERDYRFATRRHDIALRSMRHDSIYTATQLSSIKQSIERMQENIRMINRNLENLTIRAPISGRLSSFHAERGETRSAGENLGQIDVLEGYKLRARIDERYVNRTYVGQQATFDYGGENHLLEINKIYSEITGGAFHVDLHFTNGAPEGIRRGQTFQLRLQFSGLTDALIIPRGGFYQETGGNWIYVLDASGNQAVRRRIRIGRQNIHHYEVLEGLEPGERVIVSSYDSYGGRDRLIFR